MTNKTTTRHAIAANIRRLLASASDVQIETELAARTHLHQSTVRTILCGNSDVDVDTLDIIAKALDVPPKTLLSSSAPSLDPIARYRDRIAALPPDQQQRIQDFIDLVSAEHEGEPVN